MNVGQAIGMALVGPGIVEMITTVLLVARRRRGDRRAARTIGVALLVSFALSSIGVVLATTYLQ